MMQECSTPDENGRRKLCCPACGLQSAPTLSDPAKYFHQCDPSLIVKANNFARDLRAHVKNGLRLVDDDERERRRAICVTNACGQWGGDVCKHYDCGCGMPEQATTKYLDALSWESKHCPHNPPLW